MQITAQEINHLLGGKLEGDPNVLVKAPAKIEEAGEGEISFIANPKYEKFAYTTHASVLVVSDDLSFSEPLRSTVIRVPDPYSCFSILLDKFGKFYDLPSGVDEDARIANSATLGSEVHVGTFSYVGENARIGDGVKIFPQVFIGDDVQIGEKTVIYPGVKIYPGCKIGSYCILHAGTIIGSDGFGFAPQQDGSYKKISQTGIVVIEDKVEIGANTVIDRASVGETTIKSGVKLDNLIQIAHNVSIGEHSVIAAQAGISGSTKVGKYVRIGGQAGVVGHIEIADKVGINAQSGVSKAVTEEGARLTGSPAWDFRDALRSQSLTRHLPALVKRIEELEKLVTELKKNND